MLQCVMAYGEVEQPLHFRLYGIGETEMHAGGWVWSALYE